MSKTLDITRLMYHKSENLLTVCESDIKDFGISMIVGSYDTFEIQGKRERRRYMSAGCVREQASNEIGDILYWDFRPVNAYQQYQPGPTLRVFND